MQRRREKGGGCKCKIGICTIAVQDTAYILSDVNIRRVIMTDWQMAERQREGEDPTCKNPSSRWPADADRSSEHCE